VKHALFCILLLLTGCSSLAAGGDAVPEPSATEQTVVQVADSTAGVEVVPTFTPTTALPATVTPTSTPIPIPTATPTPDPYAGLTVMDLMVREYGAGVLQIEQVLGVSQAFTRTLISYPSDGLTVYGFMNVPPGPGPFPVVIVNHGYIDPAVYTTLTYTTRYADALARNGYIAIHPNFRNYPPSDPGPNAFRVGYAVDVLTLIGLVRAQGGQPGPLAGADPERIGLWGHSMGGGVSLRVSTVSPHVDATVLYGSMSGDEVRNHERILFFSDGARGSWADGSAPSAADLLRLSPIYHLGAINAAISIHHGQFDEQVPLDWSLDLCERLQALEKDVECFVYDGQPHTFVGEGDALFIQRTVSFFDRYLK